MDRPDEFWFFGQCLAKTSLLLKGGKCSGGKHSEVCLNGLAAGNGYGKMILKFFEGKSKNPMLMFQRR